MWNVFNNISISDQMSTNAMVFHAFSRAVGRGIKKMVLKTVWKRIENDDFCDFGGRITSGQPPGAPNRFLSLRGGKKNEKKTVRGKKNHEKTMEKEND